MLCTISDQQWRTLPHPNVWSSQLTNDGGQWQKCQRRSMKSLCLFFTLNLDLEEKRMERSNCTGQLTKGASQSRLCQRGRESTESTGWRNKEKFMGSYIWHVQDSVTSGTAGSRCSHKAFQHLSLSIFQFWFSSVFTSFLGNLSVWWLQQLQAQNLPEREFLPPNSSWSLLAFLFWVWPRSQAHRWPTHCGRGSGVCGLAMPASRETFWHHGADSKGAEAPHWGSRLVPEEGVTDMRWANTTAHHVGPVQGGRR